MEKVVKKPAKKPEKKKVVEKPILKQTFNQKTFDNIINQLSFSDLSLTNICKSFDLNPAFFYMWLEGNEERIKQYTRARELQADFLADQIIDISNDKIGDTIIIYKDGVPIEVEDKEFVSRSKLKIDARKWIASKLKPKKYGDKIEVEQKTELSGKIEHTITGMQIVNSEKIEPGE